MDYEFANIKPSLMVGDNFEGIHDINLFRQIYLGEESCNIDREQHPSSIEPNIEEYWQLPIWNWQQKHCKDWASNVLISSGLGHRLPDLWPLEGLEGSDLLSFSREDFYNLIDDECSHVLHLHLQDMKATSKGGDAQLSFERDISGCDSDPLSGFSVLPKREMDDLTLENFSLETSTFEDICNIDEFSCQSRGYTPDGDVEVKPELFTGWKTPEEGDAQLSFERDISGCDSDPLSGFRVLPKREIDDLTLENFSLETSTFEDICNIDEFSCQSRGYTPDVDVEVKPELFTGWMTPEGTYQEEEATTVYRADDDDEDEDEGSQLVIPEEMLDKVTGKNRNRDRGPKNWEFLARLLLDKRTNPAIIGWEDEETYTFRLHQPILIARTWFARSSEKTPSTYNNFARGLRYHYKSGIMLPIKERQLVYSFGPPAYEYLEYLREGKLELHQKGQFLRKEASSKCLRQTRRGLRKNSK